MWTVFTITSGRRARDFVTASPSPSALHEWGVSAAVCTKTLNADVRMAALSHSCEMVQRLLVEYFKRRSSFRCLHSVRSAGSPFVFSLGRTVPRGARGNSSTGSSTHTSDGTQAPT